MKINKPYKLLEINVTEENGFNGSYKKATGVFYDKSKPSKKMTVTLPTPIAKMPEPTLQTMKDTLAEGKSIYLVIKGVTTRHRADGKGSYEVTDYKWI
jgi:hypothetical protein